MMDWIILGLISLWAALILIVLWRQATELERQYRNLYIKLIEIINASYSRPGNKTMELALERILVCAAGECCEAEHSSKHITMLASNALKKSPPEVK